MPKRTAAQKTLKKLRRLKPPKKGFLSSGDTLGGRPLRRAKLRKVSKGTRTSTTRSAKGRATSAAARKRNAARRASRAVSRKLNPKKLTKKLPPGRAKKATPFRSYR